MTAVDSPRRPEREAQKAPDAFRTISEVAEDLDIPQHVLRFWETRFGQIKPMKRGGGRRYYRPDDIDLLRGIRHLLYGEGYTIRGVQRLLKERGVKFVQGVWLPGGAAALKALPKETDVGPEQDTAEPLPELEPKPQPAPAIVRSLATPLPIEKSRGEPPLARPLSPALGSGAAASQPAPQQPAPAKTAEAPRTDTRAALQTVLRELAECRRLLDVAMKD